MKKKYTRLVPVLLFASLLAGGPITGACKVQAAEQAATQQEQKNVLKGQVLGVSKKARTITIDVDKNPVMVKFDDNTKGLEHAKTGEGAVIAFEERDGDKIATVIKQRLVQLPQGVVEMKTDELAQLIALGPAKGNYYLVDSRPGKRFHEGHLPTAVSLPLSKMEENSGADLPAEAKASNTMLIFYCGGPT